MGSSKVCKARKEADILPANVAMNEKIKQLRERWECSMTSYCQGFTPNVLWIKFSIFIIRWILRKLPIFLHNLVDILYTYIIALQGSEIYALNHV